MERDYFIFKTQIDFSIKSDTVEPDTITKELNIKPSNSSFKKGDIWVGHRTGKQYVRSSNIWRIETECTFLEEETVSHHIKYLKEILLPKIDILKRYKEDNRFDVSFWICIETDNAGVGFYFEEEELRFLTECSNWIHMSVLPNKNFDKQD